jgi:putative heme-binding domain-containing protein
MPPSFWMTLRTFVALALVVTGGTPAQDGGWVWGPWEGGLNRPVGEVACFRRTFRLAASPSAGVVRITADNHFVLWVNGTRVESGDDWMSGRVVDVAGRLRAGENTLAVKAWNDAGPAGLFAEVVVELPGQGALRITTDGSWRVAKEAADGFERPGFDDRSWESARVLAPLGGGPWGGAASFAGSREDFAPLPGFVVEEVASGVGSIITVAQDDAGNPLVAVERGPVLRLEDEDGDGTYETSSVVTDQVTSCQGLLWWKGALLAVGQGPDGTGLYRVVQGKGAGGGGAAGQPRPELLAGFKGDMGEHGPHAVVPGPDGRLYVVVGNHAHLDPGRLPQGWTSHGTLIGRFASYEGHVLPRDLDPRGHARDIRAPGGTVWVVDEAARTWTLFAQGFRNAYDVAFNGHGDLFAYDSDMEWDIGLPWYRPTRLYHVIRHGEYGWRTGSSKWPEWYEDCLPFAIDCGRGSPTGMVFYDATQFPSRFQQTLFGADWAQGRILAFHLTPDGTTYTGRTEVLLSGRPMNVTDMVVERSGSLLFTCGGRGTRGALYRLRYEGASEPAPSRPAPQLMALDAETPREELLGLLDHPDRFVRYRAGATIQTRQPFVADGTPMTPKGVASLGLIIARAALGESTPRRHDIDWASWQKRLETAPRDVLLLELRALSLTLIGLGERDAGASDLGPVLCALFPTGDRRCDRECAQLLVRLAPRDAVPELLAALSAERSRVEQIHLASCLRHLRFGWTADGKRQFFRWLEAARSWRGGASFPGYIDLIRQDFAKLLVPEDAEILAALVVPEDDVARLPLPQAGPARDGQRVLDFLRNSLGTERRSLAEGARVYQRSCAACHAFGQQGAAVGPELTDVASRFSLEDLLIAVVDPSREISDQYRALDVFTTDDEIFTGLPVLESETALTLLQATGEKVEIVKDRIDVRRFATTSGMPEGLLDALSQEEVADLFAYLLSGRSLEPPAETPWKPLFDGNTLEGWEGDAALWRVEGGVVYGDARGIPRNSFLGSKATWSDFVLQFELLLEEGNSGCQFRATREADFAMSGYQADAGAIYWGSLYEENGRGMLALAPKVNWEPALDPAGWNHYVIEALGDRIRITLNGVPTVVFRDDRSPSGHLGFQLHAGPRTAIRLRNALIRVP